MAPAETAAFLRSLHVLPFVARVHAVASSGLYPNVHFTDDGSAIVLERSGSYEAVTSRPACIRRLNDYGFRKRRGANVWEHPNFCRDTTCFAGFVRNVHLRAPSRGSDDEPAAASVTSSSPLDELQSSMRTLKRRHEDLENGLRIKRRRLLEARGEQAQIEDAVRQLASTTAQMQAQLQLVLAALGLGVPTS